MKENEELLETIQAAFYAVAELAGDNLPEKSYDADPELDHWIDEQWSTYNASLEAFKNALKMLKEGLR